MMFASSAVRAASRQVVSTASRRTFSAAATKVVQHDSSRKVLLATTAGLALAVAVLQDREVRVEQVMSRSIERNCEQFVLTFSILLYLFFSVHL
jgi:hypothetical protein